MNNSPADRRSPLGLFPGEPTARLYDRLVEVLRTQHYSLRSKEAYLRWLRRLLLFHNSTHPRELAENDYEDVQTTVGQFGGTKLFARADNTSLWFTEKDGSRIIPKGAEALLIAEADLEKQFEIMQLV